ncbi:MAG: hypothetical protein U5J64_11165 [Halobacteriales archaeon]|nr:hypothetical protein [Halobacteriales archaeon]
MVDEEHLPPYVTAEEVDFEMDLDTAALVLSAISSVVVIAARTGYLDRS